jgi:phage-related protein
MRINTLKGVKDNRVYISKNHHIIRATKSGGAIPIDMTKSRNDVMNGGATNLNNVRNTLKNLKLSGVKSTKKKDTRRYVNF